MLFKPIFPVLEKSKKERSESCQSRVSISLILMDKFLKGAQGQIFHVLSTHNWRQIFKRSHLSIRDPNKGHDEISVLWKVTEVLPLNISLQEIRTQCIQFHAPKFQTQTGSHQPKSLSSYLHYRFLQVYLCW